MSRTRRGVLLGMAAGAITTILLFLIAPYVIAPMGVNGDAGRLAYALGWSLLPALSLLAGIGFIARHRFFNAEAIDGGNPPNDETLKAARAYLQNTTEQFLLALPVWLALAAFLPERRLGTVALLAICFTISRALFAAGYRYGAAARSFGFAGTFYPTVLGAMIALYLFWTS